MRHFIYSEDRAFFDHTFTEMSFISHDDETLTVNYSTRKMVNYFYP